jgi:hypothetical protein
MEELMERKNPDYTNSAVNMVNPTSVKTALKDLRILQQELAAIRDEIQGHIPAELVNHEAGVLMAIESNTNLIKHLIDIDGSYQEPLIGAYAVKQRKVSLSYNPQPIKEHYPNMAPMVIQETVNVKALEGLIKGGLVTPGELKKNGITEEHESFSYIVKV